MADTPIDYQQNAAGVVTITLNRPERSNAFDSRVIQLLTEALLRAGSETACRIVVLAGKGKHFSAGADLEYMKQSAALSKADNLADANALAALMSTLDRLNKPTIARVQGAAYGGALGLICACDIAIAGEDARFCLSEVRLGLAPAVISPYVIRAIGPRQARRYFLSAEVMDSAAALQLGIIHQVVPADRLDVAVELAAAGLLKNGPGAMAACKELIERVAQSVPEHPVLDYTSRVIADLRTGAEGQEGLTAFLEKRRPYWSLEQPNSSNDRASTNGATNP